MASFKQFLLKLLGQPNWRFMITRQLLHLANCSAISRFRESRRPANRTASSQQAEAILAETVVACIHGSRNIMVGLSVFRLAALAEMDANDLLMSCSLLM